MRFQVAQIGGFQNSPICVWSGVRVEPCATPRLLISLIAAAYFALVSAGGGCGRNWSAACRANGLTKRQWVNAGCANAGGVSWYSPGPAPGLNGMSGAFEPSFARRGRSCAATASPTRMPWDLWRPDGSWASRPAYSWSIEDWRPGYRSTGASGAPASAAAAVEALRGP